MKTLLITLSLFFIGMVKADFNSAVDAYAAGNYKSAYDQFMSMASVGEKRSQFNLGIMHYQGQYVPKNINKAYAWLKLATEDEAFVEAEKQSFEIVKAKIEDLTLAEKEYKRLAEQYSTQVVMNKLYPEFVQPINENSYSADPLKMENPRYPKNAAIKGIQGWVRFGFDLDIKGVPRNIQLLESVPKTVFVNSSRKAIEKWRFRTAKDANGNLKPQQNLLYTMQFQLSGASPLGIKPSLYKATMDKALEGDFNAQYAIGFWEKRINMSTGKENPSKWFLKAALKGHPYAQYELGKSLVYGKGCIQDKTKGVEWLTKSAYSGQQDAKQLLASVASRGNTLESQLEALEYLKGIKKLSEKTKLDYAWMLATTPYKEVADPKKALRLVKSISRYRFSDDITLYEIKAAAYAAMGDFDEAIDQQKDALEEAEDREADITDIKDHLASYQKNEKWF